MIHSPENPDDIIDRLADLFERHGAEVYLGEDVTVAEHMLQCAALARAEGADDALVAAALLHDVGHLTEAFAFSMQDTVDHRHDAAGAAFLRADFPPAVTEAVRLHVAAKRYLCATRDDYHERLSAASQHSLSLQGGRMTAAEVDQFRALPFHDAAVSVRLWDDAGKAVGVQTQPFSAYLPLLRSVLTGSVGG